MEPRETPRTNAGGPVRYARLRRSPPGSAQVTAAPWGVTFLIVGGRIAWRRSRDEIAERERGGERPEPALLR
jgi:hypothetical protein